MKVTRSRNLNSTSKSAIKIYLATKSLGAEMTAATSISLGLDNPSFERLRALVRRGYQPVFTGERRQAGFAGIDLVHSKRMIEDAPQQLTLWSDGTLATSSVLWPKQYVHSDDGPPDWQRIILAEENERFDAFARGVPLPSFKDRYVNSTIFEGQVFMGRLIFGSLLCVSVAFSAKVVACFL